jgi:serine/threonine-protein phosphatase 2A regulatory subunit B''
MNHSTVEESGGDAFRTVEGERIGYDGFARVVAAFGAKGDGFLGPGTFARFPVDARGRVSTVDLFQYVMRQVSLRQIRIGFCYYDSAGYGYLREEDLENYVFEQIPSLPQLQSLGSEFYPFYVCTAVRKFFFFLDPGRHGKIGIRQLITSPILAELFELRGESPAEDNWFSAASAQRVYGQYLNLDRDRNGMLSRPEMARYGEGTLTAVFLDRLFETQHTYGGEIDFKSFLDFTLAMEHKKTPQGLAYFWRILDVQHRGFLTSFDLNVFFREVQRKLADAGHDPVDAADVRDEIFDMVHPADPYKITLADLQRSGCGDTIVSILTDVKGFWLYDHRESL